MLSPSSVKTATRLDVAITPLMADALQVWSQIYINQSPWLVSGMKSLNLGAAIAAEVARDVTIEMDVAISGSPRAEFLNSQFVPVLNNLRTYTEYACAKGGLWFKPYIKGNTVPVDYVQADQGYPIAFDANGQMTAAIFADQKTIGKTYYTRLEYHAMTPNGYQITNTAWQSTVKEMLGNQLPTVTKYSEYHRSNREFLSPVVPEWADVEAENTIEGVSRPLFAYFKMPFANNIDPTSPLGVSVYSRAAQSSNGQASLLRQVDQQWDDFLWEFESGKRAVYTTPEAFAKGTDGKPLLPDRRLYRLLDLSSVQLDKPGFFHDWTPTLREVNLLNGLDGIFRRIEFVCGLSYGVLSNPDSVALTATEIKSSKQRYYATVTDTQKSLQDALDGLLYAIDVWCTLGNLAPAGVYEVAYEFDDSIIVDKDTQRVADRADVAMGAMSLVEYRMRTFGETEKQATEKIKLIRTERADRVMDRVQTVRQ